MPCALNGSTGWRDATGPIVLNCNVVAQPGWNGGGAGDLCTNHYTALAYRIRHAPNNPAQTAPFLNLPLLEDYMRLYMLMVNEALVLQLLGGLNTAFGWRWREVKSTSNYTRLSVKLSSFEHQCWFPQTHLIALGILPANTFISMLQCGYMIKDVGAGANHGEFSHRLQWHAVMRLLTNGFTTAMAPGWNHSPFELYSMLGEGDCLQRGLWGTLFDNANGDGCTDPSRLDQLIRNSTLGFLSRQLKSIRDKRADITTRSNNEAAVAQGTNVPAVSGKTNAVVYGETQAAAYQRMYLRRKGYTLPGPVLPGPTALLVDLRNHDVSMANRLNQLSRTLGFRQHYVTETIQGGQLLKLDGDTLVDPLTIPARRLNSRANLQP